MDKNNVYSSLKRILLIDCGDVTFGIFFKSYNIYQSRLEKRNNEEVLETDLAENEEFLKIMKKQFINTTKRLKFKYNVKYQHIFYIKDSPSEQNWRKKFYEEYKNNRNGTKYKNKNFQLGNLFKKIYRKIYPIIKEKFNINIIQINNAEADDTISVITQNIPNHVITIIISSDTDYLQLLTRNNIFIYTLNGQLVNKKLEGKTAEEKLLCKVLYGDKTDNIPPCITNTKLIKYYLENPLALFNELKSNQEIFNKFNLNRLLIDFTYIPTNIKDNILLQYEKCISTISI